MQRVRAGGRVVAEVNDVRVDGRARGDDVGEERTEAGRAGVVVERQHGARRVANPELRVEVGSARAESAVINAALDCRLHDEMNVGNAAFTTRILIGLL